MCRSHKQSKQQKQKRRQKKRKEGKRREEKGKEGKRINKSGEMGSLGKRNAARAISPSLSLCSADADM